MRYLIVVLISIMYGCAAHEIEFKGDKMIFSVKNDRETYFHYSVDNFKPHKMEKEGGYWTIVVDKMDEFKFFYTDDRGVKSVDCAEVENDDFGNINCIFKM